MAEKDGASKATAPRPTITLPERSSVESFFRGTDTSPGPMTLVSSFFSENDPESECRSFSQLLAGAIASPNAISGRKFSFSASNSAEDCAGDRGTSEGGGEEGFRFKQNRPLGLAIAQSPYFTIPPGLSPTSLLESPGLFSSGQGQFGISHQQVLAQVTAQAAQSQTQIHIQTEYPSSLSTVMTALTHPVGSVVNAIPLQQMPPSTSDAKNTIVESIEFSHSDQRSQLPTIDKPSNDGYNWRKYGQKLVKGSEHPRSYYKCTHPNCPVKKKVERSLDGQVTEIIYKGEHNHQKPPLSRRAKEGGLLASGSPELNGNLDLVVKSEAGSQGYTGNMGRRNENIAAPSTSRRDRDLGHATHEQLSGSSDGEEVGDADNRKDEGNDGKPDSKRRNIDHTITESVSSHRTVMEPRIIVQTTSEVDLLDDGYRWRKYGQKVVRGNPHPRSYYKCTNVGCNVRKHVERASTDPKAVITTYEGKHNHDVPAARNSSHNTANAAAANNVPPIPPPNSIPNKIASVNRMNFRNDEQKPSVLIGWKCEPDAA